MVWKEGLLEESEMTSEESIICEDCKTKTKTWCHHNLCPSCWEFHHCNDDLNKQGGKIS